MSFNLAAFANVAAAALNTEDNALGLQKNYGQVIFDKIIELSQRTTHREQVQEVLNEYNDAQKQGNTAVAIDKGEAVLLLTTPYDTDSEWHQIRQRSQGELEQLKKVEAEEEDGEVQEYSPGKLQYPPSPIPTLIEDSDDETEWTELGEFEEVRHCRQNKKGKQAQRQVRRQHNFSDLREALKKAQKQDDGDR
jgi:hypothetical protein